MNTQVVEHLETLLAQLEWLSSSSTANLNDLICNPLLIAPQRWPACSIRFRERHLQLCPRNLVRRPSSIDLSKQWKFRVISSVVFGGQIQKHGGLVDEFNLCMTIIDLLEEQTRYYARRRLVKIMPVNTAINKSHFIISG